MEMTQQHLKKKKELAFADGAPYALSVTVTQVQLLSLPPTVCSFVSSGPISQPPQRILHLWPF